LTDSKRALLREALDSAGRIENEWTQSRALLRLLPHLPADLVEDALAIVRAMGDLGLRGKTLAAVAPYLNGEAKDDAMHDALDAARQTLAVTSRASALSRLARQASHAQERLSLGHEALAAIRQLKDATAQILELSALPDELLPEALTWVRDMPEAWSRIDGLCALAERLEDGERIAVVSEALTLAYGLDEADLRAVALCSVVGFLDGSQKPVAAREALAAAQSSQDDAVRVIVFESFAADFPDEIIDEALALTQEMSDVAHRACAVAALAPRLRDVDREAAIREAFAHIDRTDDTWTRNEVLCCLVKQLPVDLHAQALVHARALEDEWANADALGALSEVLSGEMKTQTWEAALQAAHRAPDGWARVRALLSVARRISDSDA